MRCGCTAPATPEGKCPQCGKKREQPSDIEWSVLRLARLLDHPDPGFICVPAGQRSGRRYLARVRHSATEPADIEDHRWLQSVMGIASEPFHALYALHNSALLFEPVIKRDLGAASGRDGGFRYFGLNELRNPEPGRLADYPGQEFPPEELLAFAEIPHSANLICIWHVRDLSRSHVELVELNHDCPPGGFGVPKNLPELLLVLCEDPAFFLFMCGCYTRYQDGHSDTQWIPIRYVPDAGSLTPDLVANEPYPQWWMYD
ncbi:MAG TPA: hypothetical protein VG269_09390 [Tepidisphaeraceae bacterium]|jgi:hypothetical protein|nr:hypothetical protein [Tepidisphaeraceae bacterium]